MSPPLISVSNDLIHNFFCELHFEMIYIWNFHVIRGNIIWKDGNWKILMKRKSSKYIWCCNCTYSVFGHCLPIHCSKQTPWFEVKLNQGNLNPLQFHSQQYQCWPCEIGDHPSTMAEEDACGVRQSSPEKGFSPNNSHFSRPIYPIKMRLMI